MVFGPTGGMHVFLMIKGFEIENGLCMNDICVGDDRYFRCGTYGENIDAKSPPEEIIDRNCYLLNQVEETRARRLPEEYSRSSV